MSYVAFRVPIIGAVPPGSLHKASIYRERERETLHLQSALLLSLKVPGK